MKFSKWLTIMAIFAFAGVICFFQVGSAFSDEHNFGTVFIVLGIFFTGLAAWSGLKAKDE